MSAKRILIALLLITTPLVVKSASRVHGVPQKPSAAEEVTLYHTDPQHLWNRLHAVLHVRDGRDGNFDDDGEPFDRSQGKNLLSGEPARRALALLDEFLSKGADQLIQEPLKRALFQRDTWMLLDWSAQSGNANEALRELRLRLARVVQRLAPSDEQIRALPNNYALAVKEKRFAAEFDSMRPETPFLPPELLDAEGPWIAVGDYWNGPLALEHMKFFAGRSSFLILFRLPKGRAQTLAYVKQLREHWDQRSRARNRGEKEPDPPQFPAGTQVALLRRMFLVNRQGRVTSTPVTESLQLRVFVHPERPQIRAPAGEPPPPTAQHFYEIKLTRKGRHELLGGKSSGLHALAGESDRSYLALLGHAQDPEGTTVVMHTCTGCHGSAGIHSVNSFTGRFRDGYQARLEIRTLADEEARNARWKRDFSLGFLQGVMADKPADR